MGLLKKNTPLPEVDEATLESLRKVDLFADLDDSHLATVADFVEIRQVATGQEIVREGAYSHEFYVILSGSAEASVRGKKRMTLGPGEFFGELAIVHRTQTATVVSEDDMLLGVVDAKAFKQLLDEEHTIAVHMVQSLILRLDDVVSRPAGQLL